MKLHIAGRTIFGLLCGYLVFALPSVLLFRGLHLDPHSETHAASKWLVTAAGLLLAACGGYVSTRIAATRRPGYALGIIIAAAAVVSLIAKPGAGAVWSQLAALFGVAPAACVGACAYPLKHRTLQ